MRRVELMFVDPVSNHNKFYRMIEAGNGSFNVEYGRVGSSPQTGDYPISKWESIYESKIKKGYQDISGVAVISKPVVVQATSNLTPRCSTLLSSLLRYSNTNLTENYVSKDSVTQEQIDRVKVLLTQVSSTLSFASRLSTTQVIDSVNKTLVEVYTTIPRKMKKVRDHIFGGGELVGDQVYSSQKVYDLLAHEQELLDNLQTKVDTVAYTSDDKFDLASLGITLTETPKDEFKQVLSLIQKQYPMEKLFVYSVSHKKSDDRFNSVKIKNPNNALYFHGSRNENWWSILNTGLILNPLKAKITGKMFGYGIYFSPVFKKSLGYTSLDGSYWASGNAQKAYIAVYEVIQGNRFEVRKHESWMTQLNEKRLQEKGSYHSLYAYGGYDLRNDECIVYNENYSRIKYLIEVSK